VLRTFLVARDDGYVVLPGGLTRIAPLDSSAAVSNQAGSSSKDTWVLASEPERRLNPWLQPPVGAGGHDPTTSLASRAAENLFWLGRHAERVEAAVRILRTILGRLDVRLPGGDARWIPSDAVEGPAAAMRTLLQAVTHVTHTYP